MVLSSICGDKGKRAQTYNVHVFYICIALFYRIYITLIKKKKKKNMHVICLCAFGIFGLLFFLFKPFFFF